MSSSNLPVSELKDHTQQRGFYVLGALAALGMIAAGLADIAVQFFPGSSSPAAGAVLDWFALYNANAFYGLRGLGLLNLFTAAFGLLLFFALYMAHRGGRAERISIFALLVMAAAAAVYLSNNRALPMLGLSRQYQAAAGPAEKETLAAAGAALLAVGEDFTPGTFLGFTLIETAGVIMSIALLSGKVFGRWTGLACLAGYSLLIVYSSLVCFTPSRLEALMPISMAGGLCSMAGFLLVARRLFLLSRGRMEVE